MADTQNQIPFHKAHFQYDSIREREREREQEQDSIWEEQLTHQ